jgi:hypothetical protein
VGSLLLFPISDLDVFSLLSVSSDLCPIVSAQIAGTDLRTAEVLDIVYSIVSYCSASGVYGSV